MARCVVYGRDIVVLGDVLAMRLEHHQASRSVNEGWPRRAAVYGRAQLLAKSAHAGHLRLPAELLEVAEVGEVGENSGNSNSGEIPVKFR